MSNYSPKTTKVPSDPHSGRGDRSPAGRQQECIQCVDDKFPKYRYYQNTVQEKEDHGQRQTSSISAFSVSHEMNPAKFLYYLSQNTEVKRDEMNRPAVARPIPIVEGKLPPRSRYISFLVQNNDGYINQKTQLPIFAFALPVIDRNLPQRPRYISFLVQNTQGNAQEEDILFPLGGIPIIDCDLPGRPRCPPFLIQNNNGYMKGKQPIIPMGAFPVLDCDLPGRPKCPPFLIQNSNGYMKEKQTLIPMGGFPVIDCCLPGRPKWPECLLQNDNGTLQIAQSSGYYGGGYRFGIVDNQMPRRYGYNPESCP